MVIRILTLAALVLLVARMMIVARSRPETSSNGVTLEMSVWGMPFESALYTDVYIPEFERENPGIKVRFDHFEDYPDRVLMSHAGGIAPDVIRESVGMEKAWSRRGLNMPLDRFIDGPNGIDRKDFLPELWDGVRLNGQTYAVPQDINLIGLYYNKALFDKAGLAYPNDHWTWKDLKAAVDRLTITGPDGRVRQKGLDMAWTGDTYLPFLFEAGGHMWDGDRAAFDSPQGVEALRFYRSLMKTYTLTRSTQERGGLGPSNFFENGTVAMLIDGCWMAPSITKAASDLAFGVAPLPSDIKSLSVSSSCVWGIDRDTKHPEAAWKLAKFLSSEWALKKYWQMLWVAPPARWSALRSPEFHQIQGIPGSVPGISNQREFNDKCAWIPNVLEHGWTTLENYTPFSAMAMPDLNKAVDQVLIKNEDPKRALREAATTINKAIEDSKRSDGE